MSSFISFFLMGDNTALKKVFFSLYPFVNSKALPQGACQGTARKRDMGLLSCRPTTHRRLHVGWVCCVAGASQGWRPWQTDLWLQGPMRRIWNITSLVGLGSWTDLCTQMYSDGALGTPSRGLGQQDLQLSPLAEL